MKVKLGSMRMKTMIGGIGETDYWIDEDGIMRDSFGAPVDEDGFPLEEGDYEDER